MASITQRLDDGLVQVQEMLNEIQYKFKGLDSNDQSQRDQAESELTQMLARLNQKLKNMETDVRSVPSNSREYYESEVGDRQSDYQNFQNQLNRFKAVKNDPNAIAALKAERNKQLMGGISSNLEEALRVGIETVQTQETIQSTLLDDRKHIENIDNNLSLIDVEALDAKARTKRIARRICCSAVFVWILVAILLGLLGFTLWYKLH